MVHIQAGLFFKTDNCSFVLLEYNLEPKVTISFLIFSEVYYPDEIQDLVVYARIRGVFVLPELDAPAHAGYGWDWGPSRGLGNLTTCMSYKGVWTDFDQSSYKNISLSAEPPSGQLNPLNENVYKVRFTDKQFYFKYNKTNNNTS